MLGHLALLPLLALAPGALAAPVFKARSLPAPFHKIHARNAAPGVGSSEPSLLKPRLLGGILDPLTADIPIVGGLVDTTTDLLDGVVDTTTDLVGGVVDTATDIVGSVLDVALGININLDVGAFLTCGPVSGLFNDHQYDLGCSCAGAEGGLLLGLDVDVGAILNVVGLDAWVRAQIALGVGAYYPAHSYPTCDGNGGWNCPNGDCGSPSSSWSSASQTPAPTSVVIQSIEPSPSTTEWSSAPAPTSQWVEPTPSSSVSIWVAPGPTPAPSTSWVEPAPAAPTSTVWTEEVEDCDEDEDVGAYEEPTWEPEPTFTNYEAETTVTIPTAYVVEHTVTETATQWSTVTNTETQWSTITETATSTVTITECAPTTISVQSAPSPSPEAPAPAPSPSFSTQPTPVPSIEAVPSPTPSPSSTTSWQPVPSAVFYKECGPQQQYDIQLDLCVDLCVDALGLATVCADLDLNTGLDLPIVGPLLDGLL